MILNVCVFAVAPPEAVVLPPAARAAGGRFSKTLVDAFSVIGVDALDPPGKVAGHLGCCVAEQALYPVVPPQGVLLHVPIPHGVVGGQVEQAVALGIFPRGFFAEVFGDGDGGDVSRNLDHPMVLGARGSGRSEVHRERAQQAFFGRENGRRPAGSQPVWPGQLAIVRPQGVGLDVRHDHLFAAIGSRAAGARAGADARAVNGLGVGVRQARGRAVVQARALIVQ
jgi:hypothetical protein